MENSVLAVVARTAECGALLFIGYQLRSAQLFSVTDAEVMLRLHLGCNALMIMMVDNQR